MGNTLTLIRRIVIGLICIIPALGIIYVEYVKGGTIIKDSVEVVVFNVDMESNTLVEEGMLTTINRSLESLDSNARYFKDKESVIGKETKNFVPRSTLLYTDYFGEPDTLLEEDEFVFSVPSKWIYNMPQTVRRMDKIYFYPVKIEKGEFEGQDYVSRGDSGPIYSSTVFYVKDSTNREVQDVGSNERFDGTSSVNQLEIKITEEELRIMSDYVQRGYVFIVTYR